MTTMQADSLATHRLPEPSQGRWQILRAGLQNIWEYDDQRFVFHKGRLLLRGSNGAGKSKALEVLLPFLLDGNLAPHRLDPFGSTSRKMRWNLLGDRDTDTKVCIAYVWIEFGRATDRGPEYCTIGSGLRAHRSHSNIDSWYFVTEQRIDQELQTFDEGRVPLAKGPFVRAIGDRGAVYDTGGDYRQEVNRRLYGMPQEQYDILIEALLQLRRPQLSKELQPKELSRILSSSLPPLDEAMVGRLAEGFDRLDRDREERERRWQALRGLRRFLEVYREYACAIARAHAERVTESDSAYRRARTEFRNAEEEAARAAARVDALEAEIRGLGREEAELGTEEATLRSSDAFRAAQELADAKQQAEEAHERVERARRRADDARDERDRQAARLEALQPRLAEIRESRDAAAVKAASAADSAQLDELHEALVGFVGAHQLSSARGTLESGIQARQEALARVEAAVRDVDKAKSRWEQLEERRREREEATRARQAEHDAARRSVADTDARFAGDVRGWAGSAEVLSPSKEQIDEILDSPLEDAPRAAHAIGRSVRSRIEDERSGLTLRCDRIREQRDELQRELDRVANERHVPPMAPAWRTDREGRPGAPLYMLCEFDESVDAGTAARIEGALVGSGLLDAWISPDGAVLDGNTFDVVLQPQPVDGDRTLADALRPTPTADVSRATIDRALRSIAWVDEGPERPEGGTPAWMSGDGRWKLGPLHGALRKEGVEFIGATAREEARRRRLAELDAALREVRAELDGVESHLDEVRARLEALEAEIERFPDVQQVLAARAEAERALRELEREHDQLREASAAAEAAESKLRDMEARRDSVATKEGLAGWIDRVRELREVGAAYERAATEHLRLAELSEDACARVEEQMSTVADADARVKESATELDREDERAVRCQSRARTLRQAVGKAHAEILDRLREIRDRRTQVAQRLDEARGEKGEADQQVGVTKSLVAVRGNDAQSRDGARKSAEDQLRQFARSGLLEVARIECEDNAAEWSGRQTLLAARVIQTATENARSDAEARERAENRVVESHQSLARELHGDYRITPRRTDGSLLYLATAGTRTCGLPELARILEKDIEARDALLGDEERKLFESFLSGEAHRHLGDRLRQARALVDRMNDQMARRPMASGMLVRLGWNVTDDAPAGATKAIELILRSGHLLSDADRRALQSFLEQRLAEARHDRSPGSLREKMLRVLDYRGWFEFRIEIRDDSGRWKRMTKKTHGAGSGGQKAVMLHLPLFAAAAAFYEAADKNAARLIALDEAFAGIDRAMRGQLMGLLAEFDLDFFMTSHEEWGFYEELDGLSTYHLQREPGIPGVYADWFLWDGGEIEQRDAS